VARHAGTNQVVVLDIPLLSPASRERYGLAGVIVVDTPVEVAIRRLVDGRALGEADARARIEAQIGREERCRLADLVIDNSGTCEDLADAVDRAWAWISGLG
jgi:dephospho-CoA kinase